MLVELVKELDSKNLKKVEETLLELVKKTKSKEDVQRLFILDTFPRLFNLLSYESLRVPALSILANCANLDDNWRETVSAFSKFIWLDMIHIVCIKIILKRKF